MQLTPEVLQQFAQTSVDKLVQVDSSIIAAYLCGSTVLQGSPLLGGTTDIDLVLMDMVMPGVSGAEAMRAIRSAMWA